ncbi:MAG: radical SAM protein [Candidatus Omnitrophica bacterium]|nr:radical SAM protein [Candidatus Omnitrophota bacterium]
MNPVTLNTPNETEQSELNYRYQQERYPTYKSLKECKKRRPTGAKVAFIHPGPTIEGKKNSSWLYGDLETAGSMQPPQGICSLAAILRENGYYPTLFDAEPLGLSADEIAEKAMADDPDYVGITSYTISIRVAAHIAGRVKEIAKQRGNKVVTIIGGPHITFLPKPTMARYSEFDYGIPGEGEITIVELIDALEHNEPTENIPNLVYMKDGEPFRSEKRMPLIDMDELPLPEWTSLPRLNKYYHPAGDNLHRLPSVAIITSRGCPGKCYFCNPRGLGAKFRRHSAGYIIRMMKHLQKQFGIRDIFIVDDMFVYDRENAMELCRLMKADKELDMTWSVFCRVDYVDAELLKEMRSARCWQVGYGLESGSEHILKMINKQQSIKQMENAIKWANDVGIVVRGMFMVGNFGETKETLQQTLDFVKRNPIKDFHITFFTPMPGTGSFVQWKNYGKWNVDTTEGSTKSQHGVTFVPNDLTEDELVSFQKRIYRALLLKPSTFFYQMSKMFRPGNTGFVLRAGLGFLKYTIFKKGNSAAGASF